MEFILRKRQRGKTYESVEWVRAGKRTNSYPFWTKVLLVHSLNEAARVRRAFGLDYHQVFSFEEWRRARIGALPVEVAIDNLDFLVRDWLGPHSGLALVTWNED